MGYTMITFSVTTVLNIKECLQERTGVFNPINVKANELGNEIRNKLANNEKILNSPAIQTLEYALIEFVNNSWDARVNNDTNVNIIVTVTADEQSDNITVTVADDAKGISPDKVGTYDFIKALIKSSEKAQTKEKSSGQHLGLSLPAFELQKHGGSLELACNAQTGHGTVVTLKSTLSPPKETFFEKGNIGGENMVTEMYRTAIQHEMIGHTEDKKKLTDLILQMFRATQFGSNNDIQTKYDTENSTRYQALMTIINRDFPEKISSEIKDTWKSEWEPKWKQLKESVNPTNIGLFSPASTLSNSSADEWLLPTFSSPSTLSVSSTNEWVPRSPESHGSQKTGMRKKPSLSISSPTGTNKTEEDETKFDSKI